MIVEVTDHTPTSDELYTLERVARRLRPILVGRDVCLSFRLKPMDEAGYGFREPDWWTVIDVTVWHVPADSAYAHDRAYVGVHYISRGNPPESWMALNHALFRDRRCEGTVRTP